MWLFTGKFLRAIVEHLSESTALLCLSTTGLALYRFGWQLLLTLLFIGLTCIILRQYRPLTFIALSLFEHLPLVSQTTHRVRAFYDSAYAFCFGLLIGASAMLILRLTRHVAISGVQGTGREDEQRMTVLPMKNKRFEKYEATSALAHTGENIV
jgi:hypothetical protein